MAVGRFFQGLTAFDLLGNLIPGSVALLAALGFAANPILPSSLGGTVLFAGGGFILGSVIQAHASAATAKPKTFDWTLQYAEELDDLLTSSNNSSNRKPNEDELPFGYSLYGPFYWRLWGREWGEQLDDRILTSRIWQHLVDTHDLPTDTEEFSVLYRLMLSQVDDSSSPSRSLRIQAIRNFSRGMWITSWYVLALTIAAYVLDCWFDSGDSIWGLWEYARPTYFSVWLPTWILPLTAASSVVIFWALYRSAEEDYIEYLFADYAVSIIDSDLSLQFPEDILSVRLEESNQIIQAPQEERERERGSWGVNSILERLKR